MERRQFLQGVVVLGAGSLLPAAAGATGPTTAAELTAAIEGIFAARMGPPTAFFVLGTGSAEKVYVYRTLAVAVEGGTAADAERALAQHMYETFCKLPPGPLVWRRQPDFVSQEIPLYGETWMTAEQFEDKHGQLEEKPGFVSHSGYWVGPRLVRNTNRALVVPDNVLFDYATGNWRYVNGTKIMHRMRMRVVLPHVAGDQLQELVKQEGAPTPRKG